MYNSITRLRTLAIIGVVLLHAAAGFLYVVPTETDWMIGNVLDGVSRFCVPLFFMISGALLLHKNETIPVFMKKRAAKIILPFLIWSVFFYLFSNGFHLDQIHIKTFIASFIENDVYYHLWYFYLLIPIYLLVPLFQKVVQNLPSSTILGYSIFFILVDNVVRMSTIYLDITPKNYITEIFAYVGYLFIGYLIYHKGTFQKNKKSLVILGVLSIATIILGTYFLSVAQGSYNGLLYRYTSIPVAILTIAIMSLTASWNTQVGPICNTIAKYSFGIYLIHPFFMTLCKNYLNEQDIHALLYIFIAFVGPFICSYIIAFCISKIPFVKKIV